MNVNEQSRKHIDADIVPLPVLNCLYVHAIDYLSVHPVVHPKIFNLHDALILRKVDLRLEVAAATT